MNRPVNSALATLSVAAALSACATALGSSSTAQHHLAGLHDARYCELIELKGVPPHASATVWNTIGLNNCPDAKWRSFNAAALATELGDTLVVLNGPRHFLMDSVTARTGGVRSFHGLRMTKAATISIRTAADLVQTPYADRTINRSNTWRWEKGRTVYELVAPGGDVYAMQSYAQIKDPTLKLADLKSLGHRLKPPPGWRYRARKLTHALVLTAKGAATITQDELQDTYQLEQTAQRGTPRRHDVSITGKTHTVKSATSGTVEDDGTVTGTPFGTGSIALVGTLTGGRLNATFRLTFARGSVLGTVLMPYTIDAVAHTISFHGTARFTAGTGAYRGISSGALQAQDHNTLTGQNGRLSVSGSARY